MKCAYCGVKKVVGDTYMYDTKHGVGFCNLNHLRNWVYAHYGTRYFHAETRKVAE